MIYSIVFYFVLAIVGWNPASCFVPTAYRNSNTKVLSNVQPHSFQNTMHHSKRTTESTATTLFMAEANNDSARKLPFWLDPGTKGGAVVLSLVLFLVPLLAYNVATSVFGLDEIETGITIGVGFTVFATVAWVSTYIFRVATKDMTYVSRSSARRQSRIVRTNEKDRVLINRIHFIFTGEAIEGLRGCCHCKATGRIGRR